MRRSEDQGREDELRSDAQARLLSAAGITLDEAKTRLFPEQKEAKWFGELKERFDTFPQLHPGILWTEVERSLKADRESLKNLMLLDSYGHNMNVFGEENGQFIFVSAWEDYRKVSRDHRHIAFDALAESCFFLTVDGKLPDKNWNGNAVDSAKIFGANLAYPKFHEQLIKANDERNEKSGQNLRIKGFAFLANTKGDLRRINIVNLGDSTGTGSADTRHEPDDRTSFRG